MAKNDKTALLTNLSAARKIRHEQFSESLGNIRTELKPAQLVDRISRSTMKNAAVAGGKLADKARAHPAAVIALGSSLLAAILYRPVKSALSRISDDSDTEADYEHE